MRSLGSLWSHDSWGSSEVPERRNVREFCAEPRPLSGRGKQEQAWDVESLETPGLLAHIPPPSEW